jgi:ABC-type sugar transport system ATPase subunit
LAEIELRRLAKNYPGGVEALKPIDLIVGAGELLVVLGPSGSGKTTLLRLIAGLENPSSGSVWIDARDMSRVPPHRRDVAMVFQNPALYPHLSVFDNLAFGLRARGVSRSQARAQVNTLAGVLGLDRVLARRPAALSGGQWQRVAIGRALARQPRMILFDEPFSNLDLPLRATLREQVVELHRRFGTTLIHVTHDQAEALLMGEKIVVLDRGEFIQCGSPQTVYDQPVHRFVATFVGSPPMNILPCQIDREGEAISVHPIGAERTVRWPAASESLPRDWKAAPRAIDLGVRPEAISIREPGDSANLPPRSATLDASVRRLEFNGPELLVTLAVGPHRLVARLAANRTVHVRQRVELLLDLSRAVWFDQSTGAALPPG